EPEADGPPGVVLAGHQAPDGGALAVRRGELEVAAPYLSEGERAHASVLQPQPLEDRVVKRDDGEAPEGQLQPVAGRQGGPGRFMLLPRGPLIVLGDVVAGVTVGLHPGPARLGFLRDLPGTLMPDVPLAVTVGHADRPEERRPGLRHAGEQGVAPTERFLGQ